MADRILKPDSGNDLVLQNDDGSGKIEINENASIPVTGTLDVSGATLTTSSAQKTAIVDGGKGNLTASDVGLGNVTNESKDTMFTSPTFTGTPNLGSNPTIILGSNATGFTGVKIFDQWRLTTTFSGLAGPISSNLERVDTTGQGTIGSAMTESSGVFTFPMTGIYWIHFNAVFSLQTGDVRFIGTSINKVISGSADMLTTSYSHMNNAQSNFTYQSHSTNTTFDCTNTGTHKISFSTRELSNTAVNTIGSSSSNFTTMTFFRIGDT